MSLFFSHILFTSVDRKDWNDKMDEERQEKLQKLRDKLTEQRLRTEEKRKALAEKEALIQDVMEKISDIFK